MPSPQFPFRRRTGIATRGRCSSWSTSRVPVEGGATDERNLPFASAVERQGVLHAVPARNRLRRSGRLHSGGDGHRSLSCRGAGQPGSGDADDAHEPWPDDGREGDHAGRDQQRGQGVDPDAATHPDQPHPPLRSDPHRRAPRADLPLLVAARMGKGHDPGPALRRHADRHRRDVADALRLARAVGARHRRGQPLRARLRSDRRDFPVAALGPKGGPGMTRRKLGSLVGIAAGAVMLAGVASAHITPPVVLMSDRDAVVTLLAGAQRFFVREVRLSPAERAVIKRQTGWTPDEDFYRFYLGRDAQGRLVAGATFVTQFTLPRPLPVAVRPGAGREVPGAAVVELTEETYPWVKPLIDLDFARDYAGQDSRGHFHLSDRLGRLEAMPQFYGQGISGLIQRAALLFELGVLRRGDASRALPDRPWDRRGGTT